VNSGNDFPKVVFVDENAFIKQMQSLSSVHQLITQGAIEHVLAADGLALAKTPWLKSLGAGLWEFRIGSSLSSVLKKALAEPIGHRGNIKILVRVFVAFRGEQIILISCFDKLPHGGGKRQNKAITEARSLLLSYRRKS
jgi:hypothetical protein